MKSLEKEILLPPSLHLGCSITLGPGPPGRLRGVPSSRECPCVPAHPQPAVPRLLLHYSSLNSSVGFLLQQQLGQNAVWGQPQGRRGRQRPPLPCCPCCSEPLGVSGQPEPMAGPAPHIPKATPPTPWQRLHLYVPGLAPGLEAAPTWGEGGLLKLTFQLQAPEAGGPGPGRVGLPRAGASVLTVEVSGDIGLASPSRAFSVRVRVPVSFGFHEDPSHAEPGATLLHRDLRLPRDFGYSLFPGWTPS